MSKTIFSQCCDDILKDILEMPFIIELGEGILPQEKFHFFILQDVLYLKEYAKGFRVIAKSNEKYRDYFIKFAVWIDEEIEILTTKHAKDLEDVEQTPSNLLYTSYLLKLAYEDNFLNVLAAYYSCFWVYWKVGKLLSNKTKEDNPYIDWIKIYSTDSFGEGVKIVKDIVLAVQDQYTTEQQKEAIECFRKTSKMEYMFWNSAYYLEGWIGDKKLFYQLKPPCAMTIAGSDSSGGAGIQSDLNAFHSHQVYGTTSITVLTAQNSKGVHQISEVNAQFIKDQLSSIVNDVDIKALKTGMLYNNEIIKAVAEFLKSTDGVKIVVDPVMISTSGHTLLQDEAISTLTKEIFPYASIVTPNLDEAAKLLSMIPDNALTKIVSLQDMVEAAKLLTSHFKAKAFLIKGGHLKIDSKAVDILYDATSDNVTIFKSDFIESKNTHGTGCSLSASITSCLAKGYSLESAVLVSKNYVWRAIANGFQFGKSEIGTLNHLIGHC